MGTFKHPTRSTWHTSFCTRCNRMIQRVKLPGLQQRTTYRVCDRCLSEGTNAQNQAAAAAGTPAPAGAARRPRGRGGRRPTPQAAPAAKAE